MGTVLRHHPVQRAGDGGIRRRWVVSGHVAGETDTLPLRVEKLYNEFDPAAPFAVATLLAFLALATMALKAFLGLEEPARNP